VVENGTIREPRLQGGGSMVVRSRRGLSQVGLAMLGLAGIVGLAWYRGQLGDYPREVAPAVNALAGGHFWDAVQRQSFIGPVSVALRAPFVAVAHSFGASELTSYRLGAVPCVAAAALVGVALVRWSRPTARPRVLELLIVLLAVATPVSTQALSAGHPEEILGAALTVGGVVACLRGRYVWAALLLGLALATKQWALLAVGPAMLAAGRRHWWRVTAAACGILALCSLPLVLADHQTFVAATKLAASAPPEVQFQSWWYLVDHNLPYWLAQKTKPAIVLSALPLTILVFLRRGRGSGAASALPLLALLFLVRCVADPQTQYYYHLPLVLTLLAWDVQTRRRLPYATLATVVALLVTNTYVAAYAGSHAASIFYFFWTLTLTAYLLCVIARVPAPARLRNVLATTPVSANRAATIPDHQPS